MAFLALPAKAAIVHIILVMAADACHRQDRLAGNGFLVTAVAIQISMPAIQFETGPGSVVKVPQPPVTRVMAAFTLHAETALVDVILVVARHTFRFGILELRRDVTFVAVHDEMRTR
jgi:hypothetical protein